MGESLQIEMKTEIGPVYLTATDRGLTGVHFQKPGSSSVTNHKVNSPAAEILKRAQNQLAEYLAGNRQEFDLPLEFEGTEFQNRVWKELMRIPYGATCSYAQLASRIENEKAVRAVGSANGRNPLGIIIPCHRVINSDGGLGGYAGGLEMKARLLELEKRHI